MYLHSQGTVPDHGREPEFLMFCLRRFSNCASSQWTGRQRTRRGRKKVKRRGPIIFPGEKKKKKRLCGVFEAAGVVDSRVYVGIAGNEVWSFEFLKR
jgi:hypothetical protein